MTLDAEQMRELCRRRDAGVIATAAVTDELAAGLLAAASPEERQALIEGGRAARQEMIEKNLGLVRLAISRFVPTAAMEREDYFQEGVLGLASAVDRYDPDRTGYFSAFALPHIRGAVINLVTTRGGDLRPSQARTAGRVDREVARREALGLPTRASEVARSLQMPERAVVASRAYGRPAGLATADGPADLPDRSASGGSDEAGLPSVARMLLMLPSQERRALEAVHGDSGRTMAEIAAELGLSPRGLRGVVDSGHSHLRSLMDKADPDLRNRPQRQREQSRPTGRGIPSPGLGR